VFRRRLEGFHPLYWSPGTIDDKTFCQIVPIMEVGLGNARTTLGRENVAADLRKTSPQQHMQQQQSGRPQLIPF
jgi:hypothetical protein